jgi:hypothetical protein
LVAAGQYEIGVVGAALRADEPRRPIDNRRLAAMALQLLRIRLDLGGGRSSHQTIIRMISARATLPRVAGGPGRDFICASAHGAAACPTAATAAVGVVV